MRKTLREKEVCEKCNHIIFKEEYIYVCDVCEKEISDTDYKDGAYRYQTTIIFKGKSITKAHNLTYDFCNFECFLNGLKKIKNYNLDHIWGYSLNKDDIRKLLTLIKERE